jgi:hypothetical protein
VTGYRIEGYPLDLAESLITNEDTGAPKLPGEPVAALTVRADTILASGRDVWLIALVVSDRVLALSHDVEAGTGPTGPGLFAALDQETADVLGFPISRAEYADLEGLRLRAAESR